MDWTFKSGLFSRPAREHLRLRKGRPETETSSDPPLPSISSNTSNPVLSAIKTVEHQFSLLTWDQIELWQRDNHFITSGYRPVSNSYLRSWASLRYLHNESVNIWSHLVGAIISVIAAVPLYHSLKPRYDTASDTDVAVFGCFFFGLTVCLGLSAIYHTLSNHSPLVHNIGNKLDYLGIVFLIWGSFIPSLYYGFWDRPELIRQYWFMISAIGAGCAIVCLAPMFRTPRWRPFRAGMFICMGLSAVFPVIHGLQIYGVQELGDRIGLVWLVTHGVLYIIGALLYAARVPERFRPGAFDLFGNSHQFLHGFVLIAAVIHLLGLVKAYDYHHGTGTTPPPVIDIYGRFRFGLGER